MNLSDWRRRIDEIDKKLVELLNERSHCALEIGKLKQAANIPLYQPDRENEVLANAERTNPGPLTDAAIRRLFERIIDEARSAERNAMHKTPRRTKAGRMTSFPELCKRPHFVAPGFSPASLHAQNRPAIERESGLTMVIVMQEGATDAQIQHVIDRLVASAASTFIAPPANRTPFSAPSASIAISIIAISNSSKACAKSCASRSPSNWPAASSSPKAPSSILGRGVKIGGNEVVVAAGPCSVESREQIHSIAESVAKAGAKILRAGAFKPRTSPYAFQGLGEKGLKLMREAADKFDLFSVSEVMDPSQIQMMSELRRHFPGRRAQHAELLSSARPRRNPQTGAAEARHVRHHGRASAQRRIHSCRRQLQRHPLRARHPHLRNLYCATRSTSPPSR